MYCCYVEKNKPFLHISLIILYTLPCSIFSFSRLNHFHFNSNNLVSRAVLLRACEIMDAELNFSQVAPPVFDGENYDAWAVKMGAYLEALDLWEAIEEDYEILLLPENPTMTQMKSYKEKKTRKAKAKSCLFVGVSATLFTRIMTLKTTKEIWEYLKKEYAGDERIRGMQVLNLMREFELQKMKESETIKEYSDKLLGIVNKVRLLGTNFLDCRIIEKILVTVPERYEASITTLENTKDLSKITLAKVLHAL